MNNFANICRICLSNNSRKDINNLPSAVNEIKTSYIDILMFCLDIQISYDSKISTKLCLKCFRKVINFYKFKSLALQSDVYLRSQTGNALDGKNEVFIRADDIKQEGNCQNNDSDNEYGSVFEIDDSDIKKDSEIKEEFDILNLPSDDELLSVLKNVKYGTITDDEEKGPTIIKEKGDQKKTKKLKHKTKIEETGQICEDCGKVVKNMKEHSLLHQPNRKRYPCKMCSKTYFTNNARYKHIRHKHFGIKKKCPICNKEVIALRSHQLMVHNKDKLPFACAVCERRFISQLSLDVHTTTHTKVKLFECDVCKNKYRSRLGMLMHNRNVHNKERAHVCHVCSKSFFKKYHLQVHLRSHTQERPYKCEVCGKMFTTTSTLKSHMVLHNNVKNFKCTLCEMSFAKNGYLRAHMISHTKEKKHVCKYCGAKFGRSDHRKRHEFTAHEEPLALRAQL